MRAIRMQDSGCRINPNANPSQPPLGREGASSALPLSRGSWRGFASNGQPRQQGRGADRGFSLIELIIVIAIVSVLMSVFLDRVWYYQEMAEKTAMEETVGAIQSALTMQVGKNYVRGNLQELSKLAAQNPVKWLQKLPKNYAGEFYDLPPRSLIAGNWVFDLKAHQLIYVIDRAEHFVPGKEGKKWIRFKVAVQQAAVVSSDVDTGQKEIVGTVFEPTEKPKWFQ